MLNSQVLTGAAAEFVAGIAERHGRSPADVIAEGLGLALVAIDLRTARRLRQIEEAADLERGSLLASLLETAEQWWADDDGQLESWIEDGYDLASPEAARVKLRGLRAKWDAEEQAARHDAAPEDEDTHAATLARIMAADLATNNRATTASLNGLAAGANIKGTGGAL